MVEILGEEGADGQMHRAHSRGTSRGQVPIENAQKIVGTDNPLSSPQEENVAREVTGPTAVSEPKAVSELKAVSERKEFSSPACVDLTLRDQGVERTFTFTALDSGGKLGITFRTKVPIVITSLVLGSMAEELGMRVGMQITHVNGIDISGKTYLNIMAIFRDAVQKLPNRES